MLNTPMQNGRGISLWAVVSPEAEQVVWYAHRLHPVDSQGAPKQGTLP